MGLAVSDESQLIAQGLTSLPRAGEQKDLAAIAGYLAEWEVEAIVVGFPRNMDGTLGPAAMAVQGFVEQLRGALRVPVHLWDERLTTLAAQRTLIDAGVRRQARRGVVDQMAAAMILQGFLDRRRAAAAAPPDAT
jgi:putative Holliday junction resolvase